MDRPRLLVVPGLSPLEWPILPLLEEWADVATFEAPGVGDAPGSGRWDPEACAQTALAVVEERGWERCFVTADEWGVLNAIAVARLQPGVVQGLALGHPSLSWRGTGARPPIMGEVRAVFAQTAAHDATVWARHMTQVTQGDFSEAMADAMLERVSGDLLRDLFRVAVQPHDEIGETLTSLPAPMLFVGHGNCLLWTAEGFEDVVAAVPHARAEVLADKPSASPSFAQLLRDWVAGLQSS